MCVSLQQKTVVMKTKGWVLAVCLVLLLLNAGYLQAQCSICTKTASQMGEGPAKALNSAIIYLAAAPLLIMGYIGMRWWKNEKNMHK